MVSLKDFGKWSILGIWVGAITFILSMLKAVGWIPNTEILFSTIDVRSFLTGGLQTPGAISTAVNFLMGNYNNILGGVVSAVIIALLSGVFVVLVGRIVYMLVSSFWTAKSKTEKLFIVLMLGYIVTGFVVAMAFHIPALLTVIAMAIYFAIVTLVMVALQKLDIVNVPEN